MRKTKQYFRKMLALSLIVLLLFSLTSCAATDENIFSGRKIDKRVDLDEVPAPKTAGIYTASPSFPQLNLDEIVKLCYGDKEVTRVNWKNDIRIKGPDGGYISFSLRKDDLKLESSGTPSIPLTENCTSIDYYRSDLLKKELQFYMQFSSCGFRAAHGDMAYKLSEKADDDPLMQSALAYSEKFMEAVAYNQYELQYAWKLPAAALEEMAKVWMVDAYPTEDWYYVRYKIVNNGIDAAVGSNYYFLAEFIFDQNGLYSAYLKPELNVEAVQSGPAVSAEKAYKIALEGSDWTDCILFDVECELIRLIDQYHIAWKFSFARQSDKPLAEYKDKKYQQLFSDGTAKGVYQTRTTYVDACTGELLSMQYAGGMNITPLMHKYNAPELFK